MKLHFGGMIHDPVKKIRTIRKKTIPSPRLIEFDSEASYEEVMCTTIPIFFPGGDGNPSHYSLLAGTSGEPFEVDREKWTLGAFLKERKSPPSKTRLYVLYKPQVFSVLIS